MSKNQPITLRLPVHAVVYQYADVPTEWHVTCLEGGAFGWGPTPNAAFESLLKTIQGQYEESLKQGHWSVFGVGPDPEWVQAYKEGKHPSEEKIVIAFKGVLTVCVTLANGKSKVELLPDVTCQSLLSEEQLQHA